MPAAAGGEGGGRVCASVGGEGVGGWAETGDAGGAEASLEANGTAVCARAETASRIQIHVQIQVQIQVITK
jgi:hypothetical protein